MKACIDRAGAIRGWLGERLQTLAGTLPRGGIDVEGTDCIQKGIWFKLRGNLTQQLRLHPQQDRIEAAIRQFAQQFDARRSGFK